MDIDKSLSVPFMDIGKRFIDIDKWFTDIDNWFIDIDKSFIDIEKSRPFSIYVLRSTIDK
jgi:hypothetical protein